MFGTFRSSTCVPGPPQYNSRIHFPMTKVQTFGAPSAAGAATSPITSSDDDKLKRLPATSLYRCLNLLALEPRHILFRTMVIISRFRNWRSGARNRFMFCRLSPEQKCATSVTAILSEPHHLLKNENTVLRPARTPTVSAICLIDDSASGVIPSMISVK